MFKKLKKKNNHLVDISYFFKIIVNSLSCIGGVIIIITIVAVILSLLTTGKIIQP